VLQAAFARLSDNPSGVRVGPGDDAAVLDDGTVITTDTIVDGVHVDRRWASMSDIGWKAVHAAVSDLPAMAAIGTGLVVSAQLPANLADHEIEELLDGIVEGAAVAGVPVVGGDVVTSSTLAVAVTATGRLVDPERPLLRSGARVGDVVAVVGHLGRAAAGLGLLAAEQGRAAASGRVRASHPELPQAHRRPRALVEAAPDLAAMGVTAGIDVSDGLGRDLGHIAAASDVKILLDDIEPVDEGVMAAAEVLDVDWRELVLGGGDDYALAVTLDPSVVDALAAAIAMLGQPFRRVGEVVRGRGVQGHLVSGLEDVTELGWEHA
jgi:thiamine-monophosphate kinase